VSLAFRPESGREFELAGNSHPSTPLVFVARCDLGLGLFAARAIQKGSPVLVFQGPTISHAQCLAKGERMGNPLQIGIDEYLDLEPPAVYLNHSCDPNTAVVKDRVLIALRSINEHEELRFDYSTTMSHDGWTMECRCGAKHCRRTIGDFEYLPCDIQRTYLDLGIVQSFIRNQHSR
jgi:SET domain-containing protein